MTSPDLATLLTQLRAGKSPAAPIPCGRATAHHNTHTCPPTLAAEIARLANRPLPGLTLYKFGSRSIVGAYTLTTGDPIVLKYYYPSNPAKHLHYGINGSRCHQSWIAGIALNHLGIPTPPPLLIAEWTRLRGLWLSKSFLATRPAQGIALDAFIRTHGTDHPLLQKAAHSLQRSFHIMAQNRAIHGDLKANNLLLTDTGEITFIDLDATALLLPEPTWKTLRQKDHTRFHANWKNNPDAAHLFRNVFQTP